ncbi:hypothetical protein Tco_1132674 [Tanacetum coccineum]|uniref:Uncharacterized protein n=1 Tax=Tanacetum coccineum TaxID=301880 RepID=A0ABQ5JFN5_9ASTR
MESDQRPKRCLENMTDNAVKNRFSILRKRIVQQESSNKENNAPDVNTGFVRVQVQCTKDLQQNGRFHYHHLPMEIEFLIRKSLITLILLRALNVTIEDICGALLEGISDTLETELLEISADPFVIEASSFNVEYRRSNSVFNEGPSIFQPISYDTRKRKRSSRCTLPTLHRHRVGPNRNVRRRTIMNEQSASAANNNRVDTEMYNDLGDCNKITTVKSTEICSHQEDWESRRARMKMTKGFIAEESVKGHILLFHDLFAKAIPYMMQEHVKMANMNNDPSAIKIWKGRMHTFIYDDGLESLPNR